MNQLSASCTCVTLMRFDFPFDLQSWARFASNNLQSCGAICAFQQFCYFVDNLQFYCNLGLQNCRPNLFLVDGSYDSVLDPLDIILHRMLSPGLLFSPGSLDQDGISIAYYLYLFTHAAISSSSSHTFCVFNILLNGHYRHYKHAKTFSLDCIYKHI